MKFQGLSRNSTVAVKVKSIGTSTHQGVTRNQMTTCSSVSCKFKTIGTTKGTWWFCFRISLSFSLRFAILIVLFRIGIRSVTGFEMRELALVTMNTTAGHLEKDTKGLRFLLCSEWSLALTCTFAFFSFGLWSGPGICDECRRWLVSEALGTALAGAPPTFGVDFGPFGFFGVSAGSMDSKFWPSRSSTKYACKKPQNDTNFSCKNSMQTPLSPQFAHLPY